MFICWFGELMGDDSIEEMTKLSDETLDTFLSITYNERKKFNLWFEL